MPHKPLPPSHWKWAGDQAVLGRDRMQAACTHGAECYGIDPDEYTWEGLRDELMKLSAAAVAKWEAEQEAIREEQRQLAEAAKSNGHVEYDDWASFCLRFETIADALAHVSEIPDGDELLALADKCECTADKELDWPEYRDAVVLEIKECWA